MNWSAMSDMNDETFLRELSNMQYEFERPEIERVLARLAGITLELYRKHAEE